MANKLNTIDPDLVEPLRITVRPTYVPTPDPGRGGTELVPTQSNEVISNEPMVYGSDWSTPALPIAPSGYKLTPVDNNSLPDFNVPTGMKKLLGVGGEERYQLWPEKMVRSGLSLPGDVVVGKVPLPGDAGYGSETTTIEPNMLGQLLGISSWTGQKTPEVIERAMDTTGLMGGTVFGAGKGVAPMIAAADSAVSSVGIQALKEAFAQKSQSGLMLSDTGTPGSGIQAVAKSGKAPIAPPFYSALEQAVNNIGQAKGSGDQWLGTLRNAKGVKPEELEWTGVNEFLKGKKNVTKQELQDFINSNKVELKEVNKSELPEKEIQKEIEWRIENEGLSRNEAERYVRNSFTSNNPTKYSQWQLPGGENYREMLLTLPVQTSEKAKQAFELTKRMSAGEFNSLDDAGRRALFAERDKLLKEARAEETDPYKSSHWSEPNPIAHIRMNDRTIDGKKSLHLEEIQSDWHQQGRERGYKNLNLRQTEKKTKVKDADENVKKSLTDNGFNLEKIGNEDIYVYGGKDYLWSLKEPANDLTLRDWTADGVPDAPFKKTWHELALKRMIREAAEKGYDRLSWTPGEAQAARYDLSKQINELRVTRNGDNYEMTGIDKNKNPFELNATKDKLADTVGKEMATKIIDNKDNTQKYTGLDLKIGGEGMKGFYDQIIPKSLEKIGKEFGVKVHKGKAPTHKGYADKFQVYDKNNNYVKDFEVLDDAHKYLSDPANGVTGGRVKFDRTISEKSEPIFYIDIPQSMRDTVVGKGQPLFSGGFTLNPVEGNPFETQSNSKWKL